VFSTFREPDKAQGATAKGPRRDGMAKCGRFPPGKDQDRHNFEHGEAYNVRQIDVGGYGDCGDCQVMFFGLFDNFVC